MMTPIQLQWRNASDTGDGAEFTDHTRIGGHVSQVSRSEELEQDGSLPRRRILVRVNYTPTIKGLPREVNRLLWGGCPWRIEAIEADSHTARYATLVCVEDG